MSKKKKKNRKPKKQRKLTAAEKREKKRRRLEYMTIFVNGKQKRVKRPVTIEGMSVEEFIRENADPIWLMQNGEYELLHELYGGEPESDGPAPKFGHPDPIERKQPPPDPTLLFDEDMGIPY
ncbi:MAG: hypothetical protein ACOX52_16115 [Verrucomicrobiota bacterium]|jgi:hypothetical protein